MTDQEAMDLGRRAVACRGWRWMVGMLTIGPTGRWGHTTADRITREGDDEDGGGWWIGDYWREPEEAGAHVPDFRDPCTVGGLLALVREAWMRPEAASMRYPTSPGECGGWFVLAHTLARSDYDLWLTNEPAATEAEALVAALEAAPC